MLTTTTPTPQLPLLLQRHTHTYTLLYIFGVSINYAADTLIILANNIEANQAKLITKTDILNFSLDASPTET